MKLILIIWTLLLALANVLLFTMATAMNATFWVTFAFTLVTFVAVLLFWLKAGQDPSSREMQFLKLPSAACSLGYIGVQLVLDVIFALGAAVISYRIAILANAIVLVVAWIAILGGMAGNSHISKVNARQKDHHTEL